MRGAPGQSRTPKPWTALGRGVRRKCPNCGRGRVFAGWFRMRRDCAVCTLEYLRNKGDTWLYWIVMNRIPLAVGIILIAFRDPSDELPTWRD